MLADTAIVLQLQQEDIGKRLDVTVQSMLVQQLPEQSALFTRSYVQKLFEQQRITADGKVLSKNAKPMSALEVQVLLPAPQPAEAQPQDIPLDIVYEDEHLLVVNKPKGMVVHPAPGNPDGTLVNALLHHCRGRLSGVNGVQRPGIVHRIDKDTSGLLVVAKNDAAHLSLSEQIAAHSVTRRYFAVVYGRMPQQSGTVSMPIGRSDKDRKKYAVNQKNSKEAVTHYTVLQEFDGFSLLRLQLETGRTHQIRVHMAALGHPVAGDPVYGPGNVITRLGGQCLHAGILGFVHPASGEYMEFSAPMPEYFVSFLNHITGGRYGKEEC